MLRINGKKIRVVVEAFGSRGDTRAKQLRLKALLVAALERQLAQNKKEGSQFMVRLLLAHLKLQTATVDDAREAIIVIEPVYNELRGTEYFQQVARILSQACLKLGHFDHARYWSSTADTRFQTDAPESSLAPVFENYMRMSPELKRRLFKKRSNNR